MEPTKILLNPKGGAGLPTFVYAELKDINLAGCWGFMYSPITKRVYGSVPFKFENGKWYAWIVGKSEDTMQEGDEGFDYNEEIETGIYFPDGTYKKMLSEEIVNMVKDPVEDMIYQGLQIYWMNNIEIGEEITDLIYDPELAEVELMVSLPDTFNEGDTSPVMIGFSAKNIANPKIEVVKGEGELIQYSRSMWRDGKPYTRCYAVSGNDTEVILKATGTDAFTGELIEDEAIMAVNQKQWENVIYEDDYMVFYVANNTVYAENKTSPVYFIIKRLDKNGEIVDNRSSAHGKSASIRGSKVLHTLDYFLDAGGTWKFTTYYVKADKRYEPSSVEGTTITFEGAKPFEEDIPELPEVDIPETTIYDDENVAFFKENGKYHYVNKKDQRIVCRVNCSYGESRTTGVAGKMLALRNEVHSFIISAYYLSNPEKFHDYEFNYNVGSHKVTVKFDPIEKVTELVLDDNAFFKLLIKPHLTLGNYVFIQNKTKDTLDVKLKFEKNGSGTTNRQVVKQDGESRSLKTSDWDTVEIKNVNVGGNYHNINKTYNL